MEHKIEAVAFSMWLDKFSNIRGPENQWLSYWEHYDVWLTHEKRRSYIDHVQRSISLFNKIDENRNRNRKQD